MAAMDPERLKKAIANASEAVAKARAKNSHVLKKANIVKGGPGAADEKVKPPPRKDAAHDKKKEEHVSEVRSWERF